MGKLLNDICNHFLNTETNETSHLDILHSFKNEVNFPNEEWQFILGNSIEADKQISDDQVLTNFFFKLKKNESLALEFFLESLRLKRILSQFSINLSIEIYELLLSSDSLIEDGNELLCQCYDADILSACYLSSEISPLTKLKISARLKEIEKVNVLPVLPNTTTENQSSQKDISKKEAKTILVYARDGREFTGSKDELEPLSESKEACRQEYKLKSNWETKIVTLHQYDREYQWLYVNEYAAGYVKEVKQDDIDRIETRTEFNTQNHPMKVYYLDGLEVATKKDLRIRFSKVGKQALDAMKNFVPGVFVIEDENGRAVTKEEFEKVIWKAKVKNPNNYNGTLYGTKRVITQSRYDKESKWAKIENNKIVEIDSTIIPYYDVLKKQFFILENGEPVSVNRKHLLAAQQSRKKAKKRKQESQSTSAMVLNSLEQEGKKQKKSKRQATKTLGRASPSDPTDYNVIAMSNFNNVMSNTQMVAAELPKDDSGFDPDFFKNTLADISVPSFLPAGLSSPETFFAHNEQDNVQAATIEILHLQDFHYTTN